ncbi:hypothetical protein, partial [Afifella sp. IM 167]
LQPDNLGLFTFREIIQAEVASQARIQQAVEQIRALLAAGEVEQGLERVEQALERDPESSRLSALRGELIAAQKQVKSEQVQELLRQASALYRDDNLDAALALTEQGLALAPEHGSLQTLRGLISEERQARAAREQQLRDCAAMVAEPVEASTDVEALSRAGRCYQQ